MIYFWLKIFHIISAALLLTSLSYCCCSWFVNKQAYANIVQAQTISVIIPLVILQMFTGFSAISFNEDLNQESFNQLWIKGSAIGFVFMIVSWFGFVIIKNRKLQAAMLSICLFSLLTMIFLMTNKIS